MSKPPEVTKNEIGISIPRSVSIAALLLIEWIQEQIHGVDLQEADSEGSVIRDHTENKE